jgi:hypothetical protein
MRARVCDRCKSVILPEEETASSVITLLQEGTSGDKISEMTQWDLCPRCTNSVENYIKGKLMLLKPVTPKQEAPRGKKRTKQELAESAEKLQKAAEAGV